MLNYSINLPDSFVQEFSLDKEQVRDILDLTIKDVASKVADAWRKEAARGLSSTRRQYVDSIVEYSPAPMQAAIELVGELPNKLEEGSPSWDMKPDLLASDKAKMGKNGKYITVPFTIGTPNALAENFPTIMPEPVYEAILAKQFEVDMAGGTRTKGLRQDEVPAPYNEIKTKKVKIPKSKSYGSYTHKSSIYVGIQRQKSSVTNQSSYVSFRKVSENSDPMSWIHPGLKAHRFAEKALERVNVFYESGRIIDRILSGM
jgi:hypothetical protein